MLPKEIVAIRLRARIAGFTTYTIRERKDVVKVGLNWRFNTVKAPGMAGTFSFCILAAWISQPAASVRGERQREPSPTQVRLH